MIDVESLKIVALCIVSAVLYGIAQDQLTVRVCVEYFTIGHPPVFDTDSPTLLAFGWGIIATWWVGLLLGVPAALVSRVGSWPQYAAVDLVLPVACLMLVMALASSFAGLAGYVAASAGWVWLVEPLRSEVPESKHSAFLADLWAHLTAKGSGFWVGSSFVDGCCSDGGVLRRPAEVKARAKAGGKLKPTGKKIIAALASKAT